MAFIISSIGTSCNRLPTGITKTRKHSWHLTNFTHVKNNENINGHTAIVPFLRESQKQRGMWGWS